MAQDVPQRPQVDTDSPARGVATAATVVAAAVMWAPVAAAPTQRALGAPGGEAMAHLWGLTTSAEGLWRHGPFVRDSLLVSWPGGVHLDLVDPLHLIFVAPGLALGGLSGAVLGWNLMHLAHLLLLALGSFLLGRQVGGSERVAAIATAGALGTPYLWGGVPLGRSELLGLMLLPLLLAMVGAALRAGPQRRAVVAAAVTLSAIVLSGWQPLVQAAAIAVPATILLAWQAGVPPRRGSLRLAQVVLPAVVVAVAMLLSHLDTSPWWTERLGGAASLGSGIDSPTVDLLGALRLSALRPVTAAAVPPYPGLVAVLLLLAGLRRRPRAWALFGVALLLLTIGPRFHLGDFSERYLAPAWLLSVLVPPLGGLNDWSRFCLATGPLIALAGSLGLARWLSGRRGLVVMTAAAALLLGDGLSWRLDDRASFDSSAPDAVAQAYASLPRGAVFELPAIGPLDTTQAASGDQAMLWALSHRRAIPAAPSPFGSPMLARSVLHRLHLIDGLSLRDRCLSAESQRLYRLGFRAVVWHHDRPLDVPDAEFRSALQGLFGAPTGDDATLTWWVLPPPSPRAHDPCPPHPLGAAGRPPGHGPERFGEAPLSRDWHVLP